MRAALRQKRWAHAGHCSCAAASGCCGMPQARQRHTSALLPMEPLFPEHCHVSRDFSEGEGEGEGGGGRKEQKEEGTGTKMRRKGGGDGESRGRGMRRGFGGHSVWSGRGWAAT